MSVSSRRLLLTGRTIVIPNEVNELSADYLHSISRWSRLIAYIMLKERICLPLESTEVPKPALGKPIPILLVFICRGGTWACEPAIVLILEDELPYS